MRQEGGVSLFATWSSPGFISDVAPIVLGCSASARLDTLLIEEFADLSQRYSPNCCSRAMDRARRPGPVDERRAAHMRSSFGPPLEGGPGASGIWRIHRVEAKTEVVVAVLPGHHRRRRHRGGMHRRGADWTVDVLGG